MEKKKREYEAPMVECRQVLLEEGIAAGAGSVRISTEAGVMKEGAWVTEDSGSAGDYEINL